MQLPTYFSKTIPAAAPAIAVSAASHGLDVAQSLNTLGNVMMDAQVEAEKVVKDAERFADFNTRRSMFADRLGQLDVELSQDPDHKTYFDRAKKGLDSISADVMKDVKDPVTQQSLLEHISPARDRYLLDARHKQRGLVVDNAKASIDTSIDTSVKSAAARVDARDLMKDLGNIDATVKGGVAGGIISAEEGEKKRKAAHETVYTTLAMQMADKEPARFLENHKAGLYTDTVPPQRLEEIRRYAENRSQAVDGIVAATNAWDAMGPKGDLEPVNLDRMVASVEKQFSAEPDKAKVAIASLKEKAAAHEKGVQERRDFALSGIWKAALAGKSLASIIATPEFSSLDGKTQLTVKEHLEDRRWAMTQRHKEDDEVKAARAEAYWRYSQPEVLNGMSESSITALYPTLGVERTDALMRLKRGGETKVIEARVDTDDFNRYARQAGMDPDKKSNHAVLGEMKYSVENQIDAEQTSKKRSLTRPEKAEIIKRNMVDVNVKMNRTFLGIQLGDTTEKKKFFQVQYPVNVVVPPQEKEAIEAELKRRGIEYTPDDVVQLYVRAQVK